MTRSVDRVGSEGPHSAEVLEHPAGTWTRLVSTAFDKQLVVVGSGASLSLIPNPGIERVPKHHLQSFGDHSSTMKRWRVHGKERLTHQDRAYWPTASGP